jgi:hypothetical protein
MKAQINKKPMTAEKSWKRAPLADTLANPMVSSFAVTPSWAHAAPQQALPRALQRQQYLEAMWTAHCERSI